MDRANDVSGCYWGGASVDDGFTTTRAFTVTTAGSGSGRVDALPKGWAGEFVLLRSVGADSRYFFTKDSTATIDPTIAASSTGAGHAQRGELLPAGEAVQVLLPNIGPTETLYLARASAGAPTSLEVTKRSGKLGNNTVRDS